MKGQVRWCVKADLKAARRFLVALTLAAAAFAPGAAPADAEDDDIRLNIVDIRFNSGYLTFDLLLDGAFNEDQERILREGFPTHMTYTVELWRDRGFWFDKLELSRTLTIKVTYDLWAERFVVRFRKDDLSKFRTIEEVAQATCVLPNLELVSHDELDPSERYYISVGARLRPLTMEEVGELEDWLSGERRSDEGRGGGALSIPKYLVRMLLGSAGVAERSALTRSETFTVKSEAEGE
jgi:hypothetical protein